MASPVTDVHSPVSPPPPVYLRSSPPPHPSQHPPSPPQDGRPAAKLDLHSVPKRKPISIPTSDSSHSNAVIQSSPLSPVRIDSPSSTIPQASIAQFEDARNLPAEPEEEQSEQPRPPTAVSQALPPRRSSLAPPSVPPPTHNPPPPPQYLPYRPKPADSEHEEEPQPPKRGDSSAQDMTMPYGGHSVEKNEQDKSTISSRSSVVSVAQDSSEIYQPLQYHHQPFMEHVQSKGHRISRSTVNTGSGSSSAENLNGSHLAPGRGQASLGIPRPGSAYSDLATRGRTQSPGTSPYLQGRAVSSHSLTPPDTRPLSFVDLMNVPYPQPPPAASMLGNAYLRSSVGNNASLLSHKQTFEMYLANVKKTNDPGAQYEFAVFMVESARELTEKDENNPDAIPKADLLREAKNILQRLADRSYPYAQYYLADGLASGLFNKGKADYEKAFPLFVAASKHGHAEAGYRAGLCHEFGWGCSKNGAKAVQFYRQAASKNHPGAMTRLGLACLAGEMGLVKKYREGVTWLKRGAESADYQYNSGPYELGVLHETGYGDDVFKDEAYAAQLFTKAAELGHAEASYRMGDAYEHGKLKCPRDPALSVHFYTGAAQKGHAAAMMALCAWFLVGAEPVLEKDESEAFEWALRAAELGYPKAEYAVAYFTETGIGCRRDPLEANKWYVRAAEHGDERAKQRIAAIRAAASGQDPRMAQIPKADKPKKRFGIF